MLNAMRVRWPKVLTPTHLSQIIRNQKNPLTALQLFKEAKEKYPNYHHNGSVYATMIGILGNADRITEMKEVIEQVKEDSCACKDSVFASIIQTFSRAGMLNEAETLFKKLHQFNCISWTQSFNTLLREMVKKSRLESAYHLFSENSYGWEVKSRVQSLNLLMGALCERNRSDLALQVLQEMNYQGCYPDRESYQVLMKGLCGDGRLHEATHLLYSMFWRVSQKGSGEDVVIYRILLDALCDNGKVEEALEILVKIVRKGLKAPKRSYCRLDPSQFSNCKDTEGTKLLINEVLIRGIIPSLASYSAMAIDLYNEDRVIEGDMVLYKMRNRGFWPTPQIYEAKMAALCKDGKVEEALKVVDEERAKGYLVPNVRIYNILMKGLCDEGKSALAVEYLKKMAKQVGCVANKETYDILVNGLCSNGRFLDASRVLEEMLIKSYRPCLETYNVLIGGLCSVQRLYEAVMWVEEMVSQGLLPEICVWRSLVSSVCCNASDLDNCYETLNHPSSVS